MGIHSAKVLCLVFAAISPFLVIAYPGGPPIPTAPPAHYGPRTSHTGCL